MATMSHTDSKRKYSWWWDSHISPKNSKWLQENLTDMDVKVKHMIKLIEEDADSFARRAEMYYKKRPELMKLVEEFYRAYRALAERYDHATGALRQAHRTMAEAFPNQIPMGFADDSPTGSSITEADSRSPDVPTPIRALFDPGELQKDTLGLSSPHFHAVKRNGAFPEEPGSVTTRKGLKQLNDLFGPGEAGSHTKLADGRVRKGLNFHDAEEKERNVQNNGNDDVKAGVLSESERVGKAEKEIIALKNALAKLEAEKEASLLQYQQSLDRLSNLESEVSRAQDDSTGLNERASKAETEVQTLKEALTKLEAEREASLLQYQQCLEKITNLENSISCIQNDAGEFNERASKAETETQALKKNLARVEGEKEATLLQYKQCLEMISNLEEKLLHAEEDARRINERADKAEAEVENLKRLLSKLTEEKEASALQYQQCLETIANLEHKLSCAQEESQRLNREIEDGVAKLKGAEERCLLLERSNQTLHSELESFVQKMGNQSQELTEKQKELGRLWTCIQEERLRFVEAETAFQTLQHLHSQSQKELRSLAAELQNRAQILKNMETRNQDLQDEVQKVKEENKSLNELNLSSAVSIKNLQDEILSLRETVAKLEAEVELRVDQRNALQQEIYCLKEELNDLSKKQQAVMEQVESVGLAPDCFGSYVKELQDENSKLKEVSERERSEKVDLMEKLEIMEKLVEKNDLLENSLSDLNVELEEIRGKMKALEESCQSLLGERSILVAEKDTLISQLQIATKNLEKLSEKTNFLENSLFDANAEIKGLRVTLKSAEASYLLRDNEKSDLITERESLVSQLDITRKSLEDLEKGYTELENKYLALEKERESTIRKVEELVVSLDAKKQEYTSFAQLSETRMVDMDLQIQLLQEESRCRKKEYEEELDKALNAQKQEYACFAQLSETRMADMDLQIQLLQEESQCRKKEYEEELDKALNAQIEIFILQKCVQDLEENNFSLLVECHRLMEASKLSEKLISNLGFENNEKQVENKSLFGRIKILRMGFQQVLKRLEIGADLGCEDKIEQDQTVMHNILRKLEEMQNSILKIQDENQQSVIENSVLVALLQQLKLEAGDLATEKNTLHQELKTKCGQFLSLQSETQKLMGMNEELRSKVTERGHKEEVLKTEIENFRGQLLDLQGVYKNSQEENCKLLDEKRSLMKSVLSLEEEKHILENESFLMLDETISQSSLSLIFKDIISEKFLEINELGETLVKLHSVNDELEEKVRIMEGKLIDVKRDNLQIKESLEMSRNDLSLVRSVTDQLNCEVANGKDLLCLKEEELFEVERMLTAVKNERTELYKIVEDLKCKYDKVKVIQEDQEKQIFKLSGDYDHQSKETGYVREVNQKLKAELWKLREELEETKQQEERLSHELLKVRNEVEQWETQTAAFFSELQVSSVHEALLEGRTHELSEACESLEGRSYSKDIEIEQLKDRVSTLEGENKGLKAQLATYGPAIISLKDSITSLENHTLLHAKLHKSDEEVTKDANLVSNLHAENCLQTSEDQLSLVPDGFADLQDLQMRIKAIEKVVMEMERLAMLENLNASSKLEAAMIQIEELKSGSSLHQEDVQTSKHVNARQQEELGDELDDDVKRKQTLEISDKRNEVMTKDIMLDQISESSSYGRSRRETVEVDGQMLELWETTAQYGSIDLKVQKSQKLADYHHQIEAVKKQKSKNPSAESLVEKELGVDKLEISKRFAEPHQEGSKGKILERLDSDAQKLTNLQITVQDLKRKVEINEKGKKGKAIEHDTVKGQLEESEETIMKLFDVNRKLMMNVENGNLSFDGKSAELDESGSVRRRRISEQARRGSEKIGRLQLEVQKIQFLLLKLDDETKSRARTRIPERKTGVLLRDYLYGGVRTRQKRKKAPFCACVQPPTKGD